MSLTSPSPFPLHGPYANLSRWENLGGPGDSRPTATQIIHDLNLLLPAASPSSSSSSAALRDKVIFITGASSGMGPYMVRALATTGAKIYVGARDVEKAKGAIGADLTTSEEEGGKGEAQVVVLYMDQASLASVRSCAVEFRKLQESGSGGSTQQRQRRPRLNILINNAAVMKLPNHTRTEDGYEMQFATNHLSHFLLFEELKDLLLGSATEEFPSRVVNTSSTGHRYVGGIGFGDLMMDGGYDGWQAYGQSKLANIQMATQITRLYSARNLYGFAASPGSFRSPNLQQHCTPEEMSSMDNYPRLVAYLYNFEQACATAVWGALSPRPVEWVRENFDKADGTPKGVYLEGCSIAGRCPEDPVDSLEYGYSEGAFDRESEERLWEVSRMLVGL